MIPESKRRNNDRYNTKCDRIELRPRQEIGSEIREAAQTSGMSLQGFIISACLEKIKRDYHNHEEDKEE